MRFSTAGQDTFAAINLPPNCALADRLLLEHGGPRSEILMETQSLAEPTMRRHQERTELISAWAG
jgi:hypothetical protein